MSDNIESQVIDVIVEQLGVDREKVTPDAKFIDDLGADSLDTVELVMTFEEKFSVEVPDEDAEKLKSVADVVAYIKEHKADGTAHFIKKLLRYKPSIFFLFCP